MSQHTFTSETNCSQFVEVQIGWDKPMQQYYCVISPLDDKGELDDPLYSNLYEKYPATLDLSYFIKICNDYGVSVSKTVVDAVKQDKKDNIVNNKIDYKN